MNCAFANDQPRHDSGELEQLVKAVQNGDEVATAELYGRLRKGLHFVFFRNAGSDANDLTHDLFIVLVQHIREGRIREASTVMAYARTIAGRLLQEPRRSYGRCRREARDPGCVEAFPATLPSPEDTAEQAERIRIAKIALAKLSPKDREILTRFYVLEQTREQICTDMYLTETQFRLAKSRAKARFAEAGKRATRRSVISGGNLPFLAVSAA